MNRIFPFLILFLLTVFVVSAQSQKDVTTYKTEFNISYRSGENLDEYMKERCKLDIYFPDNLDSFTTIVWFHGGGLTGGEKSIPERLKNHGLAVIAVNYRLSPKVKSPAFIDE